MKKLKKELEPEQSTGSPCCPETSHCGLDRRDFVKSVGLGGVLANSWNTVEAKPGTVQDPASARSDRHYLDPEWPTLLHYDEEHLERIALPLGGIGTGTVSLAGTGGLRDWEIMNRPAKGFTPIQGEVAPFFCLFVQDGNETACRLLEGPVPQSTYEGSHGSRFPNENLPRFEECTFDSAYPFGRASLSDPEVPLKVELKAFNPLVPGDPDESGLPVAILTYALNNPTARPIQASICGTLPNFIGIDGSTKSKDWKGDAFPSGARENKNTFRQTESIRGIFCYSAGVDSQAEAWGTMALSTPTPEELSYRLSWEQQRWGTAWLDFWDDFSSDGRLEDRPSRKEDVPIASLAIETTIPAGETREIVFMISWHFPNRYSWTRKSTGWGGDDLIGNYYTQRFQDAWDAALVVHSRHRELDEKTREFVTGFCDTNLPLEVKEAALFNLSTLRTQTCFRTPDGHFFGWEGLADNSGCCHGSCTHVWNYEQATAFLFGELACSMREVEFKYATDKNGLMSFRVHLPLSRSQEFGKAAADGQLGCIMKVYRDWQLSGNDEMLRKLWPGIRKAVEFCWIPGGWDADRDGVMEGCQHNTMDVEYYGPNPQMGIWYLGALRAAEEMARYLEETAFASTCRQLFEQGRRWVDAHLFNGEYYEHQVRPPRDRSEVAESLLVGMGASDPTKPDYQLASGCLVDQLVGQFLAHVCGLGYLLNESHIRTTLQSIYRYNRRESLHDHFNCMRTFALAEEPALLMASYPKDRPKDPFPYFTEVMTGFEYTAAVGMLYEGQIDEGLECVRQIRSRYDGKKRS
ncbi:MAG: hypothetical protein JSU96_14390, partial [Acidobacteriota bacterium]